MTDPTVPDPATLLAHRAWLRAIARGLVRDENDVDDVEQRTWLAALRNDRPVGSIRGWLRSIVRSVVTDRHRAETRRAGREERAAKPETVPSTLHLVAEADAQRAVAAAVLALPEPYRGVILLRYFEDRTPTEIAARCGVPVDTVKTRLRRGLAMLRDALDRERGGRRAWTAVLLPIADGLRGPGAGAAIGGGLVMGLKTKLVAGFVAAAAIVAGVVWNSGTGPGDTTDAADDSAVPAPAAGSPAAARPRPDAPRGLATGRVRSRHDGLPVAGARVVFEARRGTDDAPPGAVSDADGAFSVETRGPGALRVSADGWTPATLDLPRSSSQGSVDAGTAWLDSDEQLAVEVTGPDDAPVPGATVTLDRRRDAGSVATTDSFLWEMADPSAGRTRLGTATTGPDGCATFRTLVPGGHAMEVRARGFATATLTWVPVRPHGGTTRTRVRLARAFRLEGRLLTADGTPAADRFIGVQVSERGGGMSVRTDADGRFAFDDVAAGEATLLAGRTAGAGIELATVRVPDISDIELRLPPAGRMFGRVTLADGTPVEGALVGVETSSMRTSSDDAVATTGSDGSWRIDEITAGSLRRFTVRRAGLVHVGPRLELGAFALHRGGAPAPVEARVPAGGELRVDATMARGARLHGRVSGPDGPIAGAWVTMHRKPTRAGQEWETVVCDADGRYSFDFLPPGAAAAAPTHAGYVHPDAPAELGTALGKGDVAASLLLDLPDGGDVERDFAMVPGARVAGRVVDADGTPVAGAVVVCTSDRWGAPTPVAATSDTSGAFLFERVGATGRASVFVTAAGLVQESVPEIDLAPAGRVDDVTIRMVRASTISGRVLADDGTPVAGADVVAMLDAWDGRPSRAAGVAAPDGTWSLRVPRASGTFLVRASAPGRSEGLAKVDVRPPGATVDVTLADALEVEGSVTAEGGAPVAGALVMRVDRPDAVIWSRGELIVLDGAKLVVSAVTDPAGRFRVALPRGKRSLVVRAGGFIDGEVPASVPSGDAVTVALRRAVRLTGRVVDAEGRPLAGIALRLVAGGDPADARFTTSPWDTQIDRGDSLLVRRTGADGTFSFPGIPDADWSVFTRLPGGRNEEEHGPLRAGATPHVLTAGPVAGAPVTGRIVDAAGAPFADPDVSWTLVREMRGAAPGGGVPRNEALPIGPGGAFRIDGVAPGDYTLHVTVRTGRSTIRLPDGREIEVFRHARMRSFHRIRVPGPEVVLTMADGATSSGRLVAEDGTPLAGWTVTAAVGDDDAIPGADPTVLARTARTDADGRFELRELEERDLTLSIRGTDTPHRRIAGRREFRGGAPIGDIVATLESRIRGHVVDRAGAPQPGAVVRYWPKSGGRVNTAQSSPDGSFELTGLEPGGTFSIAAEPAAPAAPGGVATAAPRAPSSAEPVTATAGDTEVRVVRE